jgi:hypothetical protein
MLFNKAKKKLVLSPLRVGKRDNYFFAIVGKAIKL